MRLARERAIWGPLRWSAPARGAAGVTLLFFALTCWWLTQDTGMPYGDGAQHLTETFRLRDALAHGRLGAVFDNEGSFYPPYTRIVIGLAVLIGGTSINVAVIGENLVFVTLLALGCYHVGRLAFERQAGLLAVVFALGAPLLIEQFHVVMLDAPLAALVAASVWLILLSERFSRVGIAALAGLMVGLGVGTKEQFPLFVAGLLAVSLRRGGWQNLRGLGAFALVAIAVGSPWYLMHQDYWPSLLDAAGTGSRQIWPVPPAASPPLLTFANVSWYGWATLNGLLFAPLCLFATVGVTHAGVTLVRQRADRRAAVQTRERARRAAGSTAARAAEHGVVPDLLVGLGSAWLALTILPHKDLRYTMPLIVYIAVLGTGWVTRLRGVPRILVTALLGLAVVATTLGATFGVGGPTPSRLPANWSAPGGEGVPPRDRVVVYANHDYMVGGPRRDDNVLELMRVLRHRGVAQIAWTLEQAPLSDQHFNVIGLEVLARVAGVQEDQAPDLNLLRVGEAALIRQRSLGGIPPCIRLGDGTGIWVRLGPNAHGRPICPLRE